MKNSPSDKLKLERVNIQLLQAEMNVLDLEDPTLLDVLDELAIILSAGNARKFDSGMG